MTRTRKLNPAKFDRCVKDVKKRGGAVNAYAVCTAAGTRNKGRVKDPALRGETAGRKNPNEQTAALDALGVKFHSAGEADRHYGRKRSQDQAIREIGIGHQFKRWGMWTQAKEVAWHQYKRGLGGQERNNPSEYQSAVEASEAFHGTDASELIEVKTDIFEHDNLFDLGELVSMDIASVNGGVVKLHGFEGARLAAAPKGYPFQLFIEGGDQSVDLAEFGIDEPHEKEVLGKLKRIKYYTVKHHLGKDGGEANYVHKLGEVSGRLPLVLYDVLNKQLEIAGGGYTILPEGIDD